jgi:hypothetical protein
MKRLVSTFVLLGSLTVTQAFTQENETKVADQTIDYVNLKDHCDILKNADITAATSVESTCHSSTEESFKKNTTHVLPIKRANTDTDEVLDSEVKMSESNLVQLCAQLESKKTSEEVAPMIAIDMPLEVDTQNVNLSSKKERKWKIVFTFGPFLSYHKKMKMHLQNDDTDVTISNLGPVQRTSLHHYKFWSGNTKPGQFIDEPQNDFTLELVDVNGKYFFGARYSHPKTLFQDNHDNPQINHHVGIVGTIGNQEVNETDVNLNNYIHTLSTSHGNTNINLFAGRNFNIVGTPGKNNLELRLGVGAGVSIANGVSKYYVEDENGDRSLKIKEHSGIVPYGMNFTGEATLRYNYGNANISLNTRGVYTRIDGTIGDFQARGDLYSGQIGVAAGYGINIKNKAERAASKIARQEKAEKKALEKEEKKSLEQMQEEFEKEAAKNAEDASKAASSSIDEIEEARLKALSEKA